MKVGYSSPCVCLTAEEGKKNRLSLEIPPCLASSHSVITTTTTQNNGYPRSDDISTKKFATAICISSAIFVSSGGMATGSLHY